MLLNEINLRQKRVEPAVTSLLQLAQQHPQDPKILEALIQTGDACRSMSANTSAMKCYDRALQMAPAALLARLGQAQALTNLGKTQEAIQVYEEILLDDPNQAVAMNNLAFLYAQEGEHLERAFKMALRLVQANPDNGLLRDTLGWVLYRGGQHEEALKQLDEAIQKAPQHSLLYYHRGLTLQALQRSEEAAAALRQALDLGGLAPPDQKTVEAALAALQAPAPAVPEKP